jgi:hypothetical protein
MTQRRRIHHLLGCDIVRLVEKGFNHGIYTSNPSKQPLCHGKKRPVYALSVVFRQVEGKSCLPQSFRGGKSCAT